MSFRKPAIAAFCAAVIIPMAMAAQEPPRRDTTRADSIRVRDSLARVTARTPVTRNNAMARQPTTFSQQRVPLQKDYGTPRRDLAAERADSIANAERMRRDSIDRAQRDSIDRAAQAERDRLAAIEKARTDSIARIERMRMDSINAANAAEAARRDSIARADSIALEADRLRKLSGGSWHIGVYGGAAVPTNDYKALGVHSGFDIGVPIEWHRPSSFIGVRMDLGYSQFNANNFVGIGTGGTPVTLNATDPRVLSGTLNLTANLPLGSSKVSLYALGGAGVYHFRKVGGSAVGSFLGNDIADGVDESVETNVTKIGAQAGAGLNFGFGRSSLFVESRFVNVFADRNETVQFTDFFGPDRSQNLRWVPIVVGIKIR